LRKRKKIPKKLLIILLFLILIVTVFQIAPNYKKQQRNSNINLIYNNKNITNYLNNNLLLKNGTIYISVTDIKNILDNNIFLEESSNKIITVCNTKVTAIDIESQEMYINSAKVPIKNNIIFENEQYYLPILELKNVYNIDAEYIEETNICVIDETNTELIGAKLKNNTNLKSLKKGLSLTIQKLKKNEEIIIINEENDGWLQIRTNSGNIGYIKKNKIKDKYHIRENMQQQIREIDLNNITNITKLRKIKTPTIEQIKTYDGRARIIEEIVDESIKNTVECLEVNYNKLKQENEPIYNRFLLELEAGLKDVGINLKK